MLAALMAENADKPVINPVVPEVAELFWAAVFFFGLWLLMKYVCLPPIVRSMQQREADVVANLEAAEAARSDAENVRRDYEATLAEARAEANSVLEAARADGESQRTEIVGAAEAEAAAAREVSMGRIAEQRGQVMDQLRGDVTTVAVAAASKVVGSELDAASNEQVVSDFIAGNN